MFRMFFRLENPGAQGIVAIRVIKTIILRILSAAADLSSCRRDILSKPNALNVLIPLDKRAILDYLCAAVYGNVTNINAH